MVITGPMSGRTVESMAQVAGGTKAKRKKDLEVLALRNTLTTTPDTVARSVGRTGIVGGII